MSTLLWSFISFIARALLSLRYRIRVKGLAPLDESGKGILFLPNHPAHMDPLILFLLLWPKYRIRPLVIEYIFRLPILKPFVRFVKAISIPNFETSVNQIKVKKAEKAILEVVEGLKRGENFILYPAGRLKSQGRENLGGSSGVHSILQEFPEAKIVLIRTTGLWGSSFSRALLGRSPDLPKTLLNGFKTIFKNLIFFCPRRDVLIEIEPEPGDLPKKGSRIELNRYLENWYNRYPDEEGKICEAEPVKLISYSFWRHDIPEMFQPKGKKLKSNGGAISSETKQKVIGEIRRILDNPALEAAPEKSLSIDLGMDSLNIAEVIAYLSQHYDVGEIHPEDLDTVQSVLEIAEGAKGGGRPTYQVFHVHWPKEKNRMPPTLPLGRTIPEAFLNACDRMGSFAACGDDLVGVLSYKKLKKSALVLAKHFQKIEEKNVAVLLPASAGAFIVILALQLAGKVPVMLNWTLGPRYLDEMMRSTNSKRVISSWRFLERVAHVDFGNLIDSVELLEDIRQSLKLKTKLGGVFLSFCSAKTILNSILNQANEEDPCVILFTSGTEANPKGVPLSHKNILANERSAMQCIDLDENDVLYGILPPFHSFGFSVAGLFPILAGLKVAFYPDPTDSFALAEGIDRWKITLFCAAPGFLKGLFSAAKGDQLKSVRYFVCGAEKAPEELYQRVEKLKTGAKLIEGYGITECAPILTINRPNLPPKGVGRILPDVELCTIHPETGALLPKGSDGEICVRGPNVFQGYIGNPRTPFIEIEGKLWYRTGDLGHLDPDGSLILSGRLKRFTKLGGEMISLGAIEEILVKELLKQNLISADIPALALCVDERVEGKPQLVLFSTVRLDKETINNMLKEAGFSRLAKISSVQKVEEIPLMGTGKTDYRRLQTLIGT